MNLVFADSFYWIALFNRRDSASQSALSMASRLTSTLVVTTDEVLVEFLAFCASDSDLRTKAGLAIAKIFGSKNIVVIPQSRDSFLAGLELYSARPDKAYSLTDCISMRTMRTHGISDV